MTIGNNDTITKKLALRLEAFDLMNTPPFSSPGSISSNTSTLGVIGYSGQPRFMLFAVKHMF